MIYASCREFSFNACYALLEHDFKKSSVPPKQCQNILGFASKYYLPLEISLGIRPREISRVSGNLWASGMDFPIPPSSWWSTDTMKIQIALVVAVKATKFITKFKQTGAPGRRSVLIMVHHQVFIIVTFQL